MKRHNEQKKKAGKGIKKNVDENYENITQLKNDIIVSLLIDPFVDADEINIKGMKIINKKNISAKHKRKK